MWLRENFSLQYQYNTKQTGDENIEKYPLGDYYLIQYQILWTNSEHTLFKELNNIWETVRGITYEFLGVKGKRKNDVSLTSYGHDSIFVYQQNL